MLNAIAAIVLLPSSLVFAPTSCGSDGCLLEPSGAVGRLVDRAWAEHDRRADIPMDSLVAWQGTAQAGTAQAADKKAALDPAKQQTPKDDPLLAQLDPKHRREVLDDIELGKKYSIEVLKELKLSTNPEYIARVQKIGAELAAIANSGPVSVSWGDPRFSPFPYTFNVVEGKDVNAFSLPGGFIYIYEGLLTYVESDHELAGVMAHEISHAAFRHVATLNKEAAKLSTVQLPLILLAIFSGGGQGAVEAITLSQLIGQAKGSGWSEKAELAADYGGFQFMRKSAYNPVGLLTFMERLARDERMGPDYPLGIFRTHPPSLERAERLMGYLKEAGMPIRRSEVSTTCSTQIQQADKLGWLVKFQGKAIFNFLGDDAKVRAEQASEKLNEFFDQVPALYEVRADPNGVIWGLNEPLFQVDDGDVMGAQKSMSQLADAAVMQIKRCLFSLAYRIWDR